VVKIQEKKLKKAPKDLLENEGTLEEGMCYFLKEIYKSNEKEIQKIIISFFNKKYNKQNI
jgi:hypothetical protein